MTLSCPLLSQCGEFFLSWCATLCRPSGFFSITPAECMGLQFLTAVGCSIRNPSEHGAVLPGRSSDRQGPEKPVWHAMHPALWHSKAHLDTQCLKARSLPFSVPIKWVSYISICICFRKPACKQDHTPLLSILMNLTLGLSNVFLHLRLTLDNTSPTITAANG